MSHFLSEYRLYGVHNRLWYFQQFLYTMTDLYLTFFILKKLQFQSHLSYDSKTFINFFYTFILFTLIQKTLFFHTSPLNHFKSTSSNLYSNPNNTSFLFKRNDFGHTD